MESAAHQIRTYESELVPGILQTPEHSRALVEKGILVPSVEEQVQDSVSLRQRRQEKLTGDDPATLLAVINESALYRQVGGPNTHREQLEYLLEMNQRDNVSIRVLPFASGAHSANYGAFVVLDYTVVNKDYALAYVEYSGGALYLEAEDEVSLHSRIFDSLWQDAASLPETEGLVKDAIQRIS